ncbi:MAG: HEAT repeat domain-containing protein, partial [Cyanobacteria bacterium J06554_11]
MADIKTSPSQPMPQPEVDELLWSTKAQVAEGAFDMSNQQLITQLVEGFNDTRGMVRLGFAELLGEIGKPATPAL